MKLKLTMAAVALAASSTFALAQAPGNQGTMGGSANSPTSEGMKNGAMGAPGDAMNSSGGMKSSKSHKASKKGHPDTTGSVNPSGGATSGTKQQ